MAGAPMISVVIATHNRGRFLPELVAALEDQQGISDYEVIFVDDCSTDDTSAVLQRLASTASIPITVMRTPRNAGPAAARNLGWQAARASVIAFTDDDCIPDRRWLAAIGGSLRRAAVAQGLTEADPADAVGRGPFARCLVITGFSWKFETCNIGYRRDVLASVGGFDEQFPAAFGEDCDLGWQALERGATTAWVPEAVVLHRVETTGGHLRDWIAHVRDTRRLTFAPLMVRKHPGLREHLHWRWFYKPQDAPTLLALAGACMVTLGRRRPGLVRIGATAFVPWLTYRTVIEARPARRRWLWAVLPMTFAGDVASIAALGRGSIRYRTFLL